MLRNIRFYILFFFVFGNYFSAFSQNEQSGETVFIYSKNMQPKDSISIMLFDSINSGKCIGFYASDTTKPAFIYEKLNGMASLITFWQNGNTKKSERYRKGILNGNCFFAYENGTLKEKGNYKNGKKNRIWKYWNTDEELVEQEKYENGILKQSFEKNNFSSLKLSKFGLSFSEETDYFNFDNLNTALQKNNFKTIFPARVNLGASVLYGNKKSFFAAINLNFDFMSNSQKPYFRTISGVNYCFTLNGAVLKKQLWSLISQAGVANIHQYFNFYSATNVAYNNVLATYIGGGTLEVKNNWAIKVGLEMDLDKKIIFPKANANTGTSAFINAGIYLPISNSYWTEGNKAISAVNPVLFKGFYIGFGICFF